jgi:NTP pyrophosphatase (non-canonical NTP hydrolase)
MELNEYQERAMATCMPSCRNYSYMYGNLASEVGEFGGKVSKLQRLGLIKYTEDGDLVPQMFVTEWTFHNEELMKEAGDILWQLSGLCEVMGWKLEDVAQQNLRKLASRKERGKIAGEGDNR